MEDAMGAGCGVDVVWSWDTVIGRLYIVNGRLVALLLNALVGELKAVPHCCIVLRLGRTGPAWRKRLEQS